MSLCYKTSNNKYFDCPPRMADGRFFTDYRPNCFINNRIKVENKLVNSYDYRMFLTRNADKLMELNKKNTFIMNGNFECKEPYNQGTMLPEQDKVVCNIQTCEIDHNYDNGVGTGREYMSDGTVPECLQSFTSAPMNLDNNDCKPVDHNNQHNQ